MKEMEFCKGYIVYDVRVYMYHLQAHQLHYTDLIYVIVKTYFSKILVVEDRA